VARALAGRGGARPYVFTKCERIWNENREIKGVLKADSIRKECEASLRRLQVDVIDLYQIHWPQLGVRFVDPASAGTRAPTWHAARR
jgi:aryl-alcohol dehydrogenase-like predicted oxidoreductase